MPVLDYARHQKSWLSIFLRCYFTANVPDFPFRKDCIPIFFWHPRACMWGSYSFHVVVGENRSYILLVFFKTSHYKATAVLHSRLPLWSQVTAFSQQILLDYYFSAQQHYSFVSFVSTLLSLVLSHSCSCLFPPPFFSFAPSTPPSTNLCFRLMTHPSSLTRYLSKRFLTNALAF